jgi:hypothetical protein
MEISSRRQVQRKPINTAHICKNPFSSDESKIKRDISSFLLKYKNKPFHPNIKASTMKKVQKKKIQPQIENASFQHFSKISNLCETLISKIDKTNSLCLIMSDKMDNLNQQIPNECLQIKNILDQNFRKTFRKINRLNNLLRLFTQSYQNNDNSSDNEPNENRKKIYFVDKACITVNFIVSKVPNDNGIANPKEKLENFLYEGNNLFIDKTIVLDGDGDADESNRRNEDVNQEQNAIENNRNDINNANQGQPMEEDSKIEDDK